MNKYCMDCKNAKDELGRMFDNASQRAFCGLKLDAATGQPVPAEGQRFPPSDPVAGVCGQDAINWVAR